MEDSCRDLFLVLRLCDGVDSSNSSSSVYCLAAFKILAVHPLSLSELSLSSSGSGDGLGKEFRWGFDVTFSNIAWELVST